MISTQEILDRAAEWGLRPEIVEKDYVLGWLLSALALHPETSEHWVFKGGTCLKKCYYETYRFSEDLDFTLIESAAYSREALEQTLIEVTQRCTELSGVEFSPDALRIRERQDPQGRTTFEGRVGYRGPLAIPSWPRIKFDLTRHELVVRAPVTRRIIHPYPDDLPQEALVGSYSFTELIAEKTRALIERVRPRDLYDVVFLLDNAVDLPNEVELRTVFSEKCRYKGIEPPTSRAVSELVLSSEELAADWEAMLAHQLPQLPPVQVVANRLSSVLVWLDGVRLRPRGGLGAPPRASGELVVSSGLEFTGSGGVIQTLRFSGANRLVVRFTYNGRPRSVEPYSLRRPATGNLLLYGFDQDAEHIKAFKVSEMVGVAATSTAFSPRYAVELTAHGPLTIPPPTPAATRSTRRRSTSRGRSKRKYVVECTVCGKRFYRVKRNTALRKHKSKDGWSCSGRRGVVVDIRH